MAEKRATFSLRRRRSLGFSNCRRPRTTLSVPSRSTFFLSRRNARSTGSPFFSLISVNALTSFPGAGQKTVLPRFPLKIGKNQGGLFTPEVNYLNPAGRLSGISCRCSLRLVYRAPPLPNPPPRRTFRRAHARWTQMGEMRGGTRISRRQGVKTSNWQTG